MTLIRNFIIGGTEQQKKEIDAATKEKREHIKQEYVYNVADQLYRAFVLGLCGALIVFPIVTAWHLALKW